MSDIIIPKLPSMLSFKRRLEIADARMSAVFPDGRDAPITSYLHRQRMPKSHAQDAKEAGDSSSAGASADNRNLAQGHRAMLPTGASHLRISFQASCLKLVEAFNSSDNREWNLRTPEFLRALSSSDEARFVAECLAYNLMSGVWAWRNREVALDAKVTVKFVVKGSNGFSGEVSADDVLSWPAYAVSSPKDFAEGIPDHKDAKAEQLKPLADAIHGALTGKTAPVRLIVEGLFELMEGQEVWPSQLRLDGVKERTFFDFGMGTPGSQVGVTGPKLANAVRTFDRFHDSIYYPHVVIPFESNGGSLALSEDLRSKEKSIFGLLPSALVNLEGTPTGDRCYLIGFFLRGGVVGVKDAEKDAEKAAKKATKDAERAAKKAKGKKGATDDTEEAPPASTGEDQTTAPGL